MPNFFNISLQNKKLRILKFFLFIFFPYSLARGFQIFSNLMVDASDKSLSSTSNKSSLVKSRLNPIFIRLVRKFNFFSFHFLITYGLIHQNVSFDSKEEFCSGVFFYNKNLIFAFNLIFIFALTDMTIL